MPAQHDLALIPFSLHTKFPASFGGDKLFYGAACASLLIVAFISTGGLIELFRVWRDTRKANRERHPLFRESWRSPINIHRIGLANLFLTSLFYSGPAAVFNLLWGEHNAETLLAVRRVQVAFWIALPIPFLFGTAMFVLGRHMIAFQLLREPLPIDLINERGLLKTSAGVIILCVLIGFLVAYTK